MEQYWSLRLLVLQVNHFVSSSYPSITWIVQYSKWYFLKQLLYLGEAFSMMIGDILGSKAEDQQVETQMMIETK